MSADATAEQDDYNREIGAKTAKDMESWLKCLQEVCADGGVGKMASLLYNHLVIQPIFFYHLSIDGIKSGISPVRGGLVSTHEVDVVWGMRHGFVVCVCAFLARVIASVFLDY